MAKQKVRRKYISFLSLNICLFRQDLNLAHDAEEIEHYGQELFVKHLETVIFI